jgi:BirA family biotin operon repressor/biotin-[acetyl-CoA-carboxylase] ligase
MSDYNLNLENIRARLSHLPISRIIYFDVTGSTNDDALAWINRGAGDGCLVVADAQMAGRGRMQRKWVTRQGTALAFSLILKPQATDRLALYAPLGALAVARALEDLTGASPQIKWPNDVLIDRKKVCGILVEAAWQGDELSGVVLGIGINVASSAVRLEDGFLFPADSLQNRLGKEIDRLELLAEVLRSIFFWRQQLGSPRFLQEWNQRLAFRGEQVQINCPGQGVLTGEILHIAQDGVLWIRRENGEEVPVLAGDVELGIINRKPEE